MLNASIGGTSTKIGCIVCSIGDRKDVSFAPIVARLWQHPPYLHDGSAATLDDSATPYNNFLRLELSVARQRDLVQLLKSLVPRLVTKISWIKITFAGEPEWG